LSSDTFIRAEASYAEYRSRTISHNQDILRSIAIIGTGNVGSALAKIFHRHGHKVAFAVRDPSSDKTKKALGSLGSIPVLSIVEGVAQAQVVILAIPFDAVEPTLKVLDTAGKIIIDATNPIGAAFQLKLGTTTSGAEFAASLAPNAVVLKAFNTIGADNFEYPMTKEGSRKDLFICGDDVAAKTWLLRAIAQLGFEPVDMGGLIKARLTEPLALVWISLAYASGWGRQHAIKMISSPQHPGRYAY
jgi:8-hydroxy-5-deazaflavin:NADPH oxidoreductase